MNAGFFGRTAPPPGAVLDRSHLLSQGLILWHAGLESSGRLARDVTAATPSGQANRHGVLTGNTAWAPWKFGGGAWNFGTSFVNLGSAHGLPIGLNQAYSFSLWVYSGAAQGATLIDNSDGSTGVCWNITLSNANGDFVRYSYNNSQATTAAYDSTYSLTWPLRTWRHVLVTDDGLNTATSVAIYINGQVQPLGGATPATGGKKTTNQATAWGQTTTGGQNQFNGRLANIQIWNRVLPAWCAEQLYNAPYQQFAPPVWRKIFVPGGAGTSYSETGRQASLILAQLGETDVAARSDLGKSVTLLAQTAETDHAAYVQSAGVPLLALTGETDSRGYTETGRLAALLLALTGETDTAARADAVGTLLLAQVGRSDVAAFSDGGRQLSAILAQVGRTDSAAVAEAGGVTLLALTGATDRRAASETGRPVVVLALTGETDNFSGGSTAYSELGRVLALILAQTSATDRLASSEARGITVRASWGTVDAAALLEHAGLSLLALAGETDALQGTSTAPGPRLSGRPGVSVMSGARLDAALRGNALGEFLRGAPGAGGIKGTAGDDPLTGREN